MVEFGLFFCINGEVVWPSDRSAFFCFCNEERPKVKAKYPSYTVGDVAKELGKRWEACTNRTKFEELAAKDKQRYERVCHLFPTFSHVFCLENYLFDIHCPNNCS